MVRALRFAVGYWVLAILLAILASTTKTHPGWNVVLDVMAGLFAVAGLTILVGTWWRNRPVIRDEVGPPDEDADYTGMIITGIPNEGQWAPPALPPRET